MTENYHGVSVRSETTMTDDLKAPERIWAVVEADWHAGDTGEPLVGGSWDEENHYLSGIEYVRADRIATLEAALADMTRQRDAAMAGVVKVEPLNWQDFANIEAGPVGIHGDNLAVALCSYFDGHMSCPDDGEDGSELDEYDCWKVWVSENAEDVLRRIAQAANARILSALTPDPDRMLALTAAAYEDAADTCAKRAPNPAEGAHSHTNAMRTIAFDCQGAILKRIPSDALAALSRIEAQAEARGMRICADIYYTRCCADDDGDDVYREMAASADATEAAAKGGV